VCGELSADDELVREAVRRSPELRDELEALTAVEARLAAAGEDRAEVLAEIAGLHATPEEDRILAGARATFSRPRPARSSEARRRVSPVPIGLAAAALLAVGLMLGGIAGSGAGVGSSSGGPSHRLGRSVRVLAPVGRVRGYDEFRWEYALQSGYTFELALRDAATGEELLTTPRLTEPRWAPPRGLELPASIAFSVYVLDHAGGIVATGDGAASRSR
jgi:hypothetical protein